MLDLAEGDTATWAIDLNAGGAALAIALLSQAAQNVLYIPGRTVYHASGSYRGDGKSDAKDAMFIADQARMRRDLTPLRAGDEFALDLKIPTARRLDLATDRTRAINRLRAGLLEYFPALERAFDYSTCKAALVLLSGYQTPDAGLGASRLAAWLKHCRVRNSQTIATSALEAAHAQHVTVPGQRLAAAVVAKPAEQVIALDTEIAETDQAIAARYANTATPRSSCPCPGSARCWRPSSSRTPAGTSPPSPAPTGSPASPTWPRCPAAPDASAATCAVHAATAAAYCASSPCPPWSPPDAARCPRRSTNASEPRANATSKPSWPWPDAA